MAVQLTDKRVRSLRPGQSLNDSQVPRLRARRQVNVVVFELSYRSGGKRRTLKLGTFREPVFVEHGQDENGEPIAEKVDPGFRCKEAREQALAAAAKLAAGNDPRALQKWRAEMEREQTLGRAWGQYLEACGKRGRSLKTVREYQKLRQHFADWENMPLASITRQTVRSRHAEITKPTGKKKRGKGKKGQLRGGPFAANRAFDVFRAVWRHAQRVDETLGPPPTIAIDRNKETRRRAALIPEDLAAWREKVEALPPDKRDWHMLALLSGLRKETVSAMAWADVDFDRRVVLIPKPKGGADRAFEMPMSDLIAEILQRRFEAAERNEDGSLKSLFVFPARSKSGHLSEPRAEGLPSPHHLRHSYASTATRLGLPWAEIKLLLNHALPSRDITGAYVHLEGRDLHVAQQRITDALRSYLWPKPSDRKVVPLRRAKGGSK